MEIRFYYETEEPYGCFSNFSAHDVVLQGKAWPTTEHFYQAQKFAGSEVEEQIRMAATPWDSKQIARRHKRQRRADWDSVKDDVMRDAVRAKFLQHADIRRVLLGTGDAQLVEDTRGDYYWGRGEDGSGKNMLGRILMEVRDELRHRGGINL